MNEVYLILIFAIVMFLFFVIIAIREDKKIYNFTPKEIEPARLEDGIKIDVTKFCKNKIEKFNGANFLYFFIPGVLVISGILYSVRANAQIFEFLLGAFTFVFGILFIYIYFDLKQIKQNFNINIQNEYFLFMNNSILKIPVVVTSLMLKDIGSKRVSEVEIPWQIIDEVIYGLTSGYSRGSVLVIQVNLLIDHPDYQFLSNEFLKRNISFYESFIIINKECLSQENLILFLSVLKLKLGDKLKIKYAV